MARRDIYHNVVKKALVSEGWIITHDPYVIPFGKHKLFVDLGAERLIAAEKEGHRIAIEIKSFVGYSEVDDLENALGQYLLYRSLLQRSEPNRIIYLAVSEATYEGIFSDPIGQVALKDYGLHLLLFNPDEEANLQWIE